jgi:hypothetical protein
MHARDRQRIVLALGAAERGARLLKALPGLALVLRAAR